MECHKCKYNGTRNEKCIECCMMDREEYRMTTHGRLIYNDGKFETAQGETDLSYLDEDLGVDGDSLDFFRKTLFDLFELSYHQILCLKAIVNGRSMQEFARDMEALTGREYTRFRAFQLRKSILRQCPQLARVLLTKGQRKALRTD